MAKHQREEKRSRDMRSHGDIGFNGERVRNSDSNYGNNREGNSVDAMLTSECVPSFLETVRYGMESHGSQGYDRSDMPKGPGAKQSGPMFGDVHSRDNSSVRPGRGRKGTY